MMSFTKPYLAGLIDGEARIGVDLEHGAQYSLGYRIRPNITIDIHKSEREVLEAIRNELGFGEVRKGHEFSIALRFRTWDRVLKIIAMTSTNVRFSSTKRKYELMKQIAECKDAETRLDLVRTLRSLSKRKSMYHRLIV